MSIAGILPSKLAVELLGLHTVENTEDYTAALQDPLIGTVQLQQWKPLPCTKIVSVIIIAQHACSDPYPMVQ